MKAYSLAAAALGLLATTLPAQQISALYDFEGDTVANKAVSAITATPLTVSNTFVFGGPANDRWLCLTTDWNNTGGSITFTVTPEPGKSISPTILRWFARTNSPSTTDSVNAVEIFANGILVETVDPLTHNTDHAIDLTGVPSLKNTFNPVNFELRFRGNPTGQSSYELSGLIVESAVCVQNTNRRDRVVWMPIAGLNDYWRAIDGGSFVEYANGTADLKVAVENLDDPNKRFSVRMNFTGRSAPGDASYPPAGSPKTNSLVNNNLAPGGPVDTGTWRYYTGMTGTLTGQKDYEGAVLSVSRRGESFQLGYGANLMTLSDGGSGWFNIHILSQPNNATHALPTSLSHGDVNMDIGLECACINDSEASWENYGQGVAGCDGVPAIGMNNLPLTGSNPEIYVGNTGNAPRQGALFWGLAPDTMFIPIIGGDLLVAAPWAAVTTILVPPGGYIFNCTIFEEPCQGGVEIYLQAVTIDPCGPVGFALSRGLKLTIGSL